jgi:hypothetical protein
VVLAQEAQHFLAERLSMLKEEAVSRVAVELALTAHSSPQNLLTLRVFRPFDEARLLGKK